MNRTNSRKGSLRLSRYYSNKEPYHGVNIWIQDAESRVVVLEAKFTIEALGDLMTGHEVRCDYLTRPVPCSDSEKSTGPGEKA